MTAMSIICPPTEPGFKRYVHIFALAVFVVALIIACVQFGEAINFSLAFPSGSTLEGSAWIMVTSLLLLALWMPCIIFLGKSKPRNNKIAMVVYIFGCIFAVILSIVATILIDEYEKPGAVRDEYQKVVTASIKNDDRLPKAILFTMDSQECCGWKGAIEFGTVISISDKVNSDFEFMTDLQKCYGDTWTVDKVKGGLEYKNAPSMSMDKIPKGCNKYYKKLVQRNCYLIFSFGVVVDVVGFIFIGLCIYLNVFSSTTTPTTTEMIDSPDFDGKYTGNDSNVSNIESTNTEVLSTDLSEPADPTTR